MNKYRIKLNPSTGLPVETKLYTFWKLEQFLDAEYDQEHWEQEVGSKPNRRRSAILYAIRECELNPQSNRNDQLTQTCRKYWKQQPKFWPRFLRERYPVARINDFFSVPYDDVKEEFYHYEGFMEEAGENPNETGRVFDPMPHFTKLKEQIAQLGEKMDMNRALKWTPADKEASEAKEVGPHERRMEKRTD